MLTNSSFLFTIARMRISCPHCSASYEVAALIKNAVLVCHRCHAEFSMEEKPIEVGEGPAASVQDSSLPLFERNSAKKYGEETGTPPVAKTAADDDDIPAFLSGADEYAEQIRREELPLAEPIAKGRSKKKRERQQLTSANEIVADAISDTTAEKTAEQSPTAATEIASDDPLVTSYPPQRAEVALWPWMIAMLLVIGSVGFWYKKDAWLDNPWFRNVLMNIYLPVEVRDKDWFIIPGSVQGHWLKRDDGSQVLVVQGRVENLLYSKQAAPKILVRFYDDSGITDSLGEKLMPITEPPSMDQVRHAPFKTPPVDKVAVESQGQRGFFLVLEELPERTADFTLSPKVAR